MVMRSWQSHISYLREYKVCTSIAIIVFTRARASIFIHPAPMKLQGGIQVSPFLSVCSPVRLSLDGIVSALYPTQYSDPFHFYTFHQFRNVFLKKSKVRIFDDFLLQIVGPTILS